MTKTVCAVAICLLAAGCAGTVKTPNEIAAAKANCTAPVTGSHIGSSHSDCSSSSAVITTGAGALETAQRQTATMGPASH